MSARPKSIACVGGGPAGLYLAILLKREDPTRRVTVFERNRADDTFGFGVIFSDQTLETFAQADLVSSTAMRAASVHWDDIDVYLHGERVTSSGHGFAGLERKRMLSILQRRAAELDVELRFSTAPDVDELTADYDLVVAADGVNSAIRDKHAVEFEPSIDQRPNRFIWLGSTQPLTSFTFYFDRDDAGLFRVHAYRYDSTASTFIVECTAETFARTGLDPADEAGALLYCERLFAHRLDGHKLLSSHSTWRRFPTIKNKRWYHDKLVLVGDAAHTAHFSIGSGTKLAIEDSIGLARAIESNDTLEAALAGYVADRLPAVARLQRAAQTSLHWFEDTERYFDRLDPLSFTYSLLTRSLRIDHDNLKERDPALVGRVEAQFSERAGARRPSSPMFTPLQLRGLTLPNRIGVAPMVQQSATDGVVGDWHLRHYGTLALGGAGLVLCEHTAIAANGRLGQGDAGLWRDDQVPAWRRVLELMRKSGSAKIGIQLGHAGRKAQVGMPTLAASPIAWRGGANPAVLERAGMDRIRDAYVRAVERALDAGFDLVELQMGHGHLLADFLSPLTNRRADAYGGAVERRLAFPLEVLDAVRGAWPKDRPLAVRISASDWQDGGLTIGDAVAIARALAEHGCDLVDVSSGETTPEAAPPYGRLYQVSLSEQLRLEARVPTMTSGGIRSAGDANAVLAGGRADVCLIGLHHLADPYFTQHAAMKEGLESGLASALRRTARLPAADVMQVEVLSADAGRDDVATVWRELEAQCRPRYWLRWGWMETWLDTLPVALRPQLVVVRDGARALAAFFVRVTPTTRHGLLRWRSARLNESGSDEHDVLYLEYNGWLQRPGSNVDVASVLDRLPLAWDELVMRRLDPQLPLALHAAAGRYRVVEICRDPCPMVDLMAARDAKEGYLSLLGKNTRSAIRRARRGYEERGSVVLERAEAPEQALAFLQELSELSRRRFAEQQGGAFESPYFRHFHEQLVRRRLHTGEIALLRLCAGGRTIGLSYNFIDGDVVGFYQSGLCYEDDNRLKPGLLLHAEAIDYFARQGLRTYDFLAGKARYKDDLATHSIELRSVRVLRPRAVFVLEEGVELLRGWAHRLRRR